MGARKRVVPSRSIRGSRSTSQDRYSFIALLVSFSAMWLMRYSDPRFSWLLEASSSVLAATFYLQAYLIWRELRGAAA